MISRAPRGSWLDKLPETYGEAPPRPEPEVGRAHIIPPMRAGRRKGGDATAPASASASALAPAASRLNQAASRPGTATASRAPASRPHSRVAPVQHLQEDEPPSSPPPMSPARSEQSSPAPDASLPPISKTPTQKPRQSEHERLERSEERHFESEFDDDSELHQAYNEASTPTKPGRQHESESEHDSDPEPEPSQFSLEGESSPVRD